MMRRRSRFLVAFLPLLFISCETDPNTPTENNPLFHGPVTFSAVITDNVVATLAMIPDSLMVFVGDRFKITARPKNAAGQMLNPIVRWTVGTPAVAKPLDSLKAVMPFKALKVGSTSITATAGTKTASTKVVVRSTTGAKVVLTPATAVVAPGATLQFSATGLTQAGEPATVAVTWLATGGTISNTGLLKAGTVEGQYRVIATSGFGAADTSIVTIGSAPVATTRVVLLPPSVAVTSGESIQFFAYGRTSSGDSVPVSVTYSGTGGTLTGTGVYTAGRTAGGYKVIATSTGGSADTSDVVIGASPIAQVKLLPDVAASRPGATLQFTASVLNALGDTVPEPRTYSATCGTVTSSGGYTAPQEDVGSCQVAATSNGKTGTTMIVLLRPTPERGIPFGLSDLWSTAVTTQSSGVAPFTASHDNVTPANLTSHISAARAKGLRVFIDMTNGSHDRYKTNGVFDLSKWQAVMNTFDTPSIRAAIADGVADGTILGSSVMDEPQQNPRIGSAEKSWGPPGTMTKLRVDGLCAYVKRIFPTLTVGVFHDALMFEPDNSYQVCEFMMAQYAQRKGDVTTWRDQNLAIAQRDGMAMVFSLNVLDGGQQDRDGVYDCAGTGGLGTYSPNCSMTPEQIRSYGKVMGQGGCAVLSWRYSSGFIARPENQSAFSDLAITLSQAPRRPCGRTGKANQPPTAEYASACQELSCDFTDQSSDIDGTISAWAWDFGDQSSSTARNPSHNYSAEGSYPVILLITDNQGATSTITHTIEVRAPAPVPPSADFSFDCADLDCTFSDRSTAGSTGSIAEWSWNFGDGASSTAQNPGHTYGAEGSYDVTVIVTDANGATGKTTQTVVVSASGQPAALP